MRKIVFLTDFILFLWGFGHDLLTTLHIYNIYRYTYAATADSPWQAVVVVTMVVRLWSLRESVTPRLDTTLRPPSSSRARAGGGVPTTTPAMIIRSQTGAQLLVVPCSAPCLGGVFGDVHHHWSSRIGSIFTSTWQLSYQGAVEDRFFFVLRGPWNVLVLSLEFSLTQFLCRGSYPTKTAIMGAWWTRVNHRPVWLR